MMCRWENAAEGPVGSARADAEGHGKRKVPWRHTSRVISGSNPNKTIMIQQLFEDGLSLFGGELKRMTASPESNTGVGVTQ